MTNRLLSVRSVSFLAVVAGLCLSSAALAALPIITRVDNPRMRIAITFDACATKTHGYGFDRAIYQILRREKIPSTIFISGRWGEFHAGVMTELAADPLIEFGNHSYDHPHMQRLSDDEIRREIDETEAVLGRFGKRSVAFRPPFGDFNDRMMDVIRARGLPVVSWDVVSGDPSAAVTAQGMIHAVSHKTRSGSIVIFHINGRGWQTASALPAILRHLRARGFEFVHVSELLASNPSLVTGVGTTATPVAGAVPAGAHVPTVVGPGGWATTAAFCDAPSPLDRVFAPEAAGPEAVNPDAIRTQEARRENARP